jgi:hypothetical protein
MLSRLLLSLVAVWALSMAPVYAQQSAGATHPRGDPAAVSRTRHPAGISFVSPSQTPSSVRTRYVSLPAYHAYAGRSIRAIEAGPQPHYWTTLPSGVYEQQSQPLLVLPLSNH